MKCSVTLTKDMERFVKAAVNSGEFLNESMLLIEALQAFKSSVDYRNFQRKELQRLIHVGLGEIDRGAVAPWDMSEIFSPGRDASSSE